MNTFCKLSYHIYIIINLTNNLFVFEKIQKLKLCLNLLKFKIFILILILLNFFKKSIQYRYININYVYSLIKILQHKTSLKISKKYSKNKNYTLNVFIRSFIKKEHI